MIARLAVQSGAQTFIHNAIMLIDTSDNDSYNQVHWLIGMPHLSTKTSNDSDFGESFIFRESFRFRDSFRFGRHSDLEGNTDLGSHSGLGR